MRRCFMAGARRASLVAAVGLVTSCAVIAGLDDDRKLATDEGSAGGSSGSGGSGGQAPDCVRATYPAPPGPGNGGGSIGFVAAIRTVDFGEIDDLPVGLDLDGECTCDGDGPSCLPPPFALEDACDGPGGRDAASSKVFSFLGAAVGSDDFGSTNFSNQAEKGHWSLLVRVSGYNGGADDDRVEVNLFPTHGPLATAADPVWDGTDAWPVPRTALADGASLDAPLYADTKAYVSEGVLVAAFPSSAVGFGSAGSPVVLELTAAFFTARVEAAGTAFRLRDGVLAGRWKLSDVFHTLSAYRDQEGAPLCTGDQFYGIIKQNVCGYADILSSLGSPTDECDSISVGIDFTADPALLGDVIDAPEPSAGCPPETDPLFDSCE